jgi:ABC-type phosphate transport system substrate-binding protein
MRKLSYASLMALAVAGLGTPAAHADIVVIGHPAGTALSNVQIADVYSGKSQVVTPLDLPDSASTRADFYRKAIGKEPAQVKALWSRLTFSGKAQPPKELGDPQTVKKAVAADPKMIGYIDKSALDGSVKMLATFN